MILRGKYTRLNIEVSTSLYVLHLCYHYDTTNGSQRWDLNRISRKFTTRKLVDGTQIL
jgi:hypothetical protein